MEAWIEKHDFWKSDETDWSEIWEQLRSLGLSDEQISELLDRVVGLASAEYGG